MGDGADDAYKEAMLDPKAWDEDKGKKQFDLMREGFQKIREALEITLTAKEVEECIVAACAAMARVAPGRIFS